MSGNRLLACSSPLGWVGILSTGESVLRLQFGYANRKEVEDSFSLNINKPNPIEAAWLQVIRMAASGKLAETNSIPVDLTGFTDFQKKVLLACQQIPRGETLTYGQLAVIAGSPKAARAVGNTMAKNPTPLIIPCHRVVSPGSLGGYSGAEGLTTKQKLLDLEGA